MPLQITEPLNGLDWKRPERSSTSVLLKVNQFSTAKPEAFPFHCLHYLHIPGQLLVKRSPQMVKNHYITVSIGKTKPWPSALKTVTIYWHFSHFSTEKPASGKASCRASTARNWLETHSWALELAGSGDQSTGTKPRTIFHQQFSQPKVPCFPRRQKIWWQQEDFFTAWVSPEQVGLESSFEVLLWVEGNSLNPIISLPGYLLL